MGRSKMAFHLPLRLVCPPLLCLLLSLLAQVSGRLDRKHYLIQTEDNDDNIREENNDYSGSTVSTSPKGYTPGSSNIQKDEDYTGSDLNEAGTDYAGDDYIGPKGPIGPNYARLERNRRRRLARRVWRNCVWYSYC